MDANNITCQFIHGTEKVICNGTEYDLPEQILTIDDMWFWIYLGIYCFLVLFAGKLLVIGKLSSPWRYDGIG